LKLVRNIDKYNSKPLEAFSFTVNTLLCICFLLCAEDFQGNSKILEIFFAPYVVRDSRQRRFVTNMQLRNDMPVSDWTKSRKDFVWLFSFQKCVKNPDFQNLASKKLTLQPWYTVDQGFSTFSSIRPT